MGREVKNGPLNGSNSEAAGSGPMWQSPAGIHTKTGRPRTRTDKTKNPGHAPTSATLGPIPEEAIARLGLIALRQQPFHLPLSTAQFKVLVALLHIVRRRLLYLFVDLTEVLLGVLNFWLDGFGTWLPVGWAHFTVFFGELESFNQSERLFDGSTDWQVVDGDLS